MSEERMELNQNGTGLAAVAAPGHA